jgi:hypothetical protein
VRDLHADMYGHSWRANDHAPASPSVSPIAEATVRMLHDAAMRQADEMLAERKANDVVAAQVSAVMAFESLRTRYRGVLSRSA